VTHSQIILVDDEEDVRLSTQQALELEDLSVTPYARPERVLDAISPKFSGVIVSDIRMPRMDGMQLLSAVREIDESIPVILVTGHGDVPLAVEAIRQGAYDFLEKPFSPDRLIAVVKRAAELRRLTLENRQIKAELDDSDPLEAFLIGRSNVMRELGQKIRTIAESEIDVLIVGETGTGKELSARIIHDLSDRKEKPFVAVNLAALPDGNIESELFGHEAGAFSGAHRARFGRFEHARGGTVFLDEIAAAPLALQAKLLRVVEERTIERVGSNERIELDVRFIASTNADLKAAVAANTFRSDLYYRLAPVTVIIPSLRERLDDAPRLFQHLLENAARRFQRETPDVSPDVLAALCHMEWPGNVREMRNVAERFVLGLGIDEHSEEPAKRGLAEQVEQFEKATIAATLSAHDGNLKDSYESLQMSRKTLYEKMQKYGLRREDFVPDEG